MLYDATGTPLEGEPEPVCYFPLGPFGTADIMGHEPGRAYGVRPIGSPLGGAYEFDGEDDYVDVSNSGVQEIAKNLTVSAWTYVKDNDSDDMIVGTEYKPGFWFFASDTPDVGFYSYISDSDDQSSVGTPEIEENQWYHVTFTYDGSQLRIYLDGELKESTSTDLDTSNPDGDATIGAWQGGTIQFFNGQISEVIIFPWALNPRQIRWLYSHPTGLRQPSSDLSLYAAALRRYGWHQSQVGGLMRYVA